MYLSEIYNNFIRLIKTVLLIFTRNKELNIYVRYNEI